MSLDYITEIGPVEAYEKGVKRQEAILNLLVDFSHSQALIKEKQFCDAFQYLRVCELLQQFPVD